ncbi:LOW QUALITY PROTEIN: uncharacterized protein LOC124253659 [Haliotis rubra]|uniref:LOW QUALITY PROTEIN: uncharacterized protein LOC124253659 n=1 Tax=Haliotis rubra TaxID=36100 RepID=UPI001EE573C0|nr:LOW QUALITY PROTEIN: uncharacterized protein LOC124253659 [Haliotis rubra]
MSGDTGPTELSMSGPVELDQLQFDFSGKSDADIVLSGDVIEENNDSSREQSALIDLIPVSMNNDAFPGGLVDEQNHVKVHEEEGTEQQEDAAQDQKAQLNGHHAGDAHAFTNILIDEKVMEQNESVDSSADSQNGVHSGQGEEAMVKDENSQVQDKDQNLLRESVRSSTDVIVESGPIPENTRPDILSSTKKPRDSGEGEDSDSEFEDEYAEQEVIQKEESESDSEFEVPDRPNENTGIDLSKEIIPPSLSKMSQDQTALPSQPVSGSSPSSVICPEVPSQPAPQLPSVTPPPQGDISTTLPSVTGGVGPTPVAQVRETDPSVSSGLPSISSSMASSSSPLPVLDATKEKLKRVPELQNSDDWENVTTIQAEFAENKSATKDSTAQSYPSPLLSVKEAVDHFKNSDLSAVKPNVRTSIERRGLSALTHFLFGPPKIHRDLLPERDMIFCVAGSQLDNEDRTHVQILQSIYRTLTGSRFDCQRFGSHWEEIGFQGRDPSTDLRGVGMLGLLQLLYFLRNPKLLALARDVYKLSLHPTQNFPFCVMGINMSRICIQSLREALLNKECNRRRQVMEVVNEFYVGTYLHLYQIWRKGKSISDSGHVIKEVEGLAKKNTKGVFKNLEEYLKKKPSADVAVEDSREEFLSVCKVEADD